MRALGNKPNLAFFQLLLAAAWPGLAAQSCWAHPLVSIVLDIYMPICSVDYGDSGGMFSRWTKIDDRGSVLVELREGRAAACGGMCVVCM